MAHDWWEHSSAIRASRRDPRRVLPWLPSRRSPHHPSRRVATRHGAPVPHARRPSTGSTSTAPESSAATAHAPARGDCDRSGGFRRLALVGVEAATRRSGPAGLAFAYTGAAGGSDQKRWRPARSRASDSVSMLFISSAARRHFAAASYGPMILHCGRDEHAAIRLVPAHVAEFVAARSGLFWRAAFLSTARTSAFTCAHRELRAPPCHRDGGAVTPLCCQQWREAGVRISGPPEATI